MASLCSFPISDLPLELLLEILYKLPVKQLHHKKIVCKLWSSLISQPSFRYEYMVRRKYSSSFTLYLTFPIQQLNWSDDVNGEFTMVNDGEEYQPSSLMNSRTRIFSLEFLPKLPNGIFYVHGSSNGLLLCRNKNLMGNRECIYYVCNPVAKQFITLPPLLHKSCSISGIVCYPSCSSSSSSCDQSAIRTQCKVVVIGIDQFSVLHSGVIDVTIFESATNRWRKLTTTLDGGLIKFDIIKTTVNPVELSGILYWLSEISRSVLAFDMNLKRCFQIPLPKKEGSGGVFGRSGDHIYYVEIDYLCTHIWSWRLDEKSSNWRIHGRFNLFWIDRKIVVNSSCLLAIHPSDCNVLYLTTHSTNKNINCRRGVYSLDFVRKQIRRLCCAPEILGNPLRSFTYIHPDWPTLVPPSPIDRGNIKLLENSDSLLLCAGASIWIIYSGVSFVVKLIRRSVGKPKTNKQ